MRSAAVAARRPALAAPAQRRAQGPWRRAWRRFRANRLGYASLMIFRVLFGLSLLAEVLSNDKPLVVRYEGQWYFPVVQTLPETTFGGDFPTQTDYLDPFIRENLAQPGNFAIYPAQPLPPQHDQLLREEPNPARAERAKLARHRRPRPRPARAAAVRLSPLGGLRAARRRDLHRLRRAVRRGAGIFRRLDRHRHGALQGDLGRDAGALHADHLLVAVLAELLRCW